MSCFSVSHIWDFRFLVAGEYGEIDEENRSKWHEERNGSRRGLQKVLESQPENRQAVVQAFGRIKKASRKEFG
ncbi:hypothetical protein ACS0TY_000359 [Phlomoides rotata]